MVAGLIQIPSAAGAADDRADLLRRMDQQADRFGAISRQIWEFAEVGYNENQSSERLKLELRSEGFEIQEDVAGIPTAFVASWGRGKPVIAILGEYDALPGLSQEDTPVEKARVAGGAGHGCGHNLFGAASAFAAVAVRHYLEEKKLPGTIRFYGCPAEEGGGGKIYMARAGAFSDCDVALAWHPGTRNQASLSSSLANITAKFRFYGKAAHAAGAPDQGRSALDAVMLMNLATELLREHVPALTRIHYIITQGGGAPNVVPGVAETFYYARHPDMAALDLIWARILKCAEAAALATETRMEMELINSVYNLLPNEALTALLDRNLKRVGGVRYSPEEQKFAEALRSTFPPEVMPSMGSQEEVETPRADLGSGSTDVADVSWVVPTAQFTTATFVPGTPGHSWQATAAAGGSIGRKGMVVAAKTLALSAVELLTMPAEVDSARRVFEKRIAGSVYRSRLPAGQKPPLNYRQN
ncbi:MAG: amidohydrolase [Acidobacteria bacterium]|nr:amidohydrolase [Acidobacteriota bacterium]